MGKELKNLSQDSNTWRLVRRPGAKTTLKLTVRQHLVPFVGPCGSLQPTQTKSTKPTIDGNSLADIYIGDTLGELGLFYRLTKITFIGGSMAHHGGHNPLEAAQLDCAVVLGPDTGNFAAITRELLEANGALQASTTDEIVESVSALLHNRTERDRIAGAATDVAIRNADAVERIHDEITRLMDDR